MARHSKYIGLLVLALTGIEAARILAFFPTPSISHSIVFRPLTNELARRGHEVIVVTPDPAYQKGKTPANLIEIDVHDISYEAWKHSYTHNQDKKSDVLNDMKHIFNTVTSIFDLQMQNPEVKEIMNKDKKYFDLLIIEGYIRPLMGVAHKFDAPVIMVTAFGGVGGLCAEMGSPSHPTWYPTGLSRYNLTLIERGFQLVEYMMSDYFNPFQGDNDDAVMKKHFGDNVPSYEELKTSVKMIFINEHPFWGHNRPIPPNIINMGGIHVPPTKDLPKDLKEYLDSSKHGVIYVSFGSNVLASVLPPEKIMVMTKVLSELPYDVLWKWDRDTLPGQSKNIKISKWLPQSDLLKHPKVKLFITQGGIQSTNEAIEAAIPVIGIPMSGDQFFNAESYAHHKMGLMLDMFSLNEKKFNEAVNSVIHDKSYKDTMIRVRGIMREYPVSPLNLTVWWAEHVIKYGGDHLKSPAAFVSWVEYYEVKLVSLMISILVLIFVILASIIKVFLRFLHGKNVNNIKSKND